jgi:hypothetical protein
MRGGEVVASIVAGDQCPRIRQAGKTTTAPDEAQEVTAEGGRSGDDAELADLLSLVEDATWGLKPAEREAIRLQLRHGLEPAAESSRSAAGPPTALRAHTLTLAADRTPSAIAHRAAVLGRAGSSRRDGFPKPVHAHIPPLRRAGQNAWRAVRRERLAVAAGVLLAIAVVIAVATVALAANTG